MVVLVPMNQRLNWVIKDSIQMTNQFTWRNRVLPVHCVTYLCSMKCADYIGVTLSPKSVKMASRKIISGPTKLR